MSSGEPSHVHVLPLSLYLKTFGALFVLTALTVFASTKDLGPFNFHIALAIATLQAAIVAAIFMRLWFDTKFYSVVLVGSLVFVAILISFSLFDVQQHGVPDAVRKDHPVNVSDPFAESESQKVLRLRNEGKSIPSSFLPPGR